MKRTSTLCLLGLPASASAIWPQSNPATEGTEKAGTEKAGTEKAIVALEQKWLQADKTNNPDLLAPLLAGDFVSTSAEGKVTGKAETLTDTKTTHWENVGYEGPVKVTVFGGTAIATGIFKGKGI